jgi:hypothetical protein
LRVQSAADLSNLAASAFFEAMANCRGGTMKPGDLKGEAVNLEESFFAKENARLLEKLRAKTDKEERREALRQVVRIQDDAFLDRLIAMGIGPETAMALRLIPLVFVAWADGEMDDREREAILNAAREQGMAAEEMARDVLKNWLEHKPDPKILTLWKDYVRNIWGRFTDDEQLRMRHNLLTAAEDVANSAGGFLGLSKISTAEREVIDDLKKVIEQV